MVKYLAETPTQKANFFAGFRRSFAAYSPTAYLNTLNPTRFAGAGDDPERNLLSAQINPLNQPEALTEAELQSTLAIGQEYGLNAARLDDLRYEFAELKSLGMDEERLDRSLRARAQAIGALPDRARISAASELATQILDPVSNMMLLASGFTSAAVRAGMVTRAGAGFALGVGAETSIMGLETAATGENRMSVQRAIFGGALEGSIGVIAGRQAVKAKDAFPKPVAQRIQVATGPIRNDDSLAGGVPVLNDAFFSEWLELGTPRRAGMLSDDPEMRAVANSFGGIVLEDASGKIIGRQTDIATLFRQFDLQDNLELNTAKSDAIAVFDLAGLSYDKGMSVLTQYRRIKNRGVEPTAEQLNISSNQLGVLREDFDTLVTKFDEFYERKRIEQQTAGVPNSDILSMRSGAEYTSRQWDSTNIKAISTGMPVLGKFDQARLLGQLIARAIRKEQGDQLPMFAQMMADGKLSRAGKQFKGRTADDILDNSLDDVKFVMERYYERFGTGFMRAVIARSDDSNAFVAETIRLDDLEEAVLRAIPEQLDDELVVTFGDDLEQAVRDVFSKRMESSDRSEFSALNRRVAMDDTFSMSIADLTSDMTPEVAQQIDGLLATVLGERRMSTPGSISVADLLNNNAGELASRYSRGANRKVGFAQRGIREEPLDIARAAKKRWQKRDKSGMGPRKLKQEKRRLNSAIYDLLTNAGYSDKRAFDEMIDVPGFVRENSTSLDTDFGAWLGSAKNFATSIFLPGVVFSQLPEAAGVVAQMGVPTLRELEQLTGVWSAMRRVGRGEVVDDLFEQDILPLLDWDPATSARGFDNVDMQMRLTRQTLDAKVYNASSDWRNMMMRANLLRPSTTIMRVLTYSRSLNRIRNWAQGRKNAFSAFDIEVNYGLNTAAKQAEAKRLIDKYAVIDPDTDTVRSFQFHRWAEDGIDAEVLARDMRLAVMDRMYTAVQEASRGFAPSWMQGGLLKFFMQFQTYAFNSLEKQGVQLLARYKAGDTETANIVLQSTFLASLAMYFSRQYGMTMGMSEKKRRERMKKALNPAQAALYSIGYMPVISAPMSLATYPISAVNAMVTGQPISRGAVPTAPAFSAIHTIANAPGGLYRAATGNATESSTSQSLRVILGGASELPYIKPMTNAGAALLAGEKPSFGGSVLTPKE